MKRKWHHPEEDSNSKPLVRSLGELQDPEAFRERHELEFPKEVESMRDEEDRELSRRGFVKLMGASTALAGMGLAACRRPVGHIVPYAKSVEWIVPGKPLLYATAMPRLGGCTPIIATTHEGRPTHLQGNPLHPANPGGGTDSFASSSILDLYDPERSGDYLQNGEVVGKDAFDAAFGELKKQIAAGGGKGLAILHGESSSPTRARVLSELAGKLPEAKAYQYEPLNHDNLNAATEAAFGEGARQVYDFSKAKRIVSLGCDFLGLDRIGEGGVAQFSEGRKPDGDGKATEKMNRLYVLEHAFTLTGGMADHRLPVAASQIPAAAAQIAAAVNGGSAGSAIDPEWVKAMVADLAAGETLVVAGPRQPVEVHALALAMNQKLGAFGKSITVVDSGAKKAGGGIAELAKAIGAGEVKTLVITTQADPVYDAPVDLKFGELLDQVENVIHLSPRNLCATARAADWQIPGTHYLEEWGDVRASDGTYSIVQPMILPLYGGVSELNFLLSLTAEEAAPAEEGAPAPAPVDAALDAVKATFADIAKAAGAEDIDQAWNYALRDGFLPNSAYPVTSTSPAAAAPEIKTQAAPNPDSFEVVFTADSKVWDGRYINNGWQQECPDPISKVVWDNAALVSIATLKKLNIREKDLVIEDKTRLIQVTVNGVDSYYPVIPAPGHADNSISISMGYGQKDAGKVAGSNDGSGTGFDCFPQRTTDSTFVATGATVKLVDEKVVAREGLEKSKYYRIALTQEHNSMEGRALVRENSAEGYDHDHDFVHGRGMESHAPKNKQIYKGQVFDYENDHQWGMAIDLNACIGCSSCTIACQSENNIPIVGKEQVIRGREMHWIRMDRYFAPNSKWNEAAHKMEVLDPDMANPQMLMQPVACQQCEAAPCETVCPVNATVHTEEGLNSMAYNRCIGTRYCMNNCPYKARRFNFFDYNKRPVDQLYKGPLSDPDQTGMRESHKLQKNPNVTVRMRGVVEKCTYCVQRLQEAKFRQKRKARGSADFRIPTDSVKTACQTACPANAIEFGDLGDKDSAVVKLRGSKELGVEANPRSYEMLGYLGVRPRTSFLARIKNPNMKMPDADYIGTSTFGAH